MRPTRRLFAALALLLVASTLALASAADPEPQVLAPWSRGFLDIHQISTGRGNAAFAILPDGTTLLIDAGDVGDFVPLATALPDDSRGAGEWIARYVRRMAGESAAIDYAVITHFHGDHVGYPYESARRSAEGGYALVGIAEVAEQVPIHTLIDRGYPDYGEPATPSGPILDNYRKFASFAAARRGMVRQRARVGRADQIVLEREPEAFPDFEARIVAANGDVWTGRDEEIAHRFPAAAELPEEDRPPENLCSVALRIRYGSFTFLTDGDLYGLPEPGAPAWWDLETPIAMAIGRTDVVVVGHHGSLEPANPFFLATLQPRVLIVPAWSPTHPSPDVLKRLLSQRIWSAPRAVFVTHLREPTKAAIGPRAARVASDAGHVVVRVDPGGATYRVYVLEDGDESGTVKSVHGPYRSAASSSTATP